MGLLVPDRYCTDLHVLDLEGLRVEGIEGLVVDLDNTLLPRDTDEITLAAVGWADRVREVGLKACLLSNNWHHRVSRVADVLDLPLVAKALKPLPFAFLRAFGILGVRAANAAVIGDQIFTDILGGNLVGAKTILVRPLSSSDLPHTLLLRRLEARIMAGREPQGRSSQADRP